MKTTDHQPSHPTGTARRITAAVLVAMSVGGCAAATSGPATTPLPVTEETATDQPTAEATVVTVADDGTASIEASQLKAQLAVMPTGTLSQADVEGLLLMREEEKLAHDVYVALYDLWGLRIFSNIAGAETNHTEAVEAALDRYGLDDPADGNAAGVFTSPELQALYEELVARGSESLISALEVGALIEDLDIVDLQSLQTDVADIAMIYANLEKGSRNHLRAFVSNLENRGETYTPVYLTREAFEAIVSSPMERGRNG